MGMRLCAQPSLRHSQIAIARFNKKQTPKASRRKPESLGFP